VYPIRDVARINSLQRVDSERSLFVDYMLNILYIELLPVSAELN
jgi:hypothetical protein